MDARRNGSEADARRMNETIGTNEFARRTAEQILCAFCNTPNPREGGRCECCGARLYVRCRHCEERNERSWPRCSACGRSLAPSFAQRLQKCLEEDPRRRGLLFEAFLLVLALLVLCLILGLLNGAFGRLGSSGFPPENRPHLKN